MTDSGSSEEQRRRMFTWASTYMQSMLQYPLAWGSTLEAVELQMLLTMEAWCTVATGSHEVVRAKHKELMRGLGGGSLGLLCQVLEKQGQGVYQWKAHMSSLWDNLQLTTSPHTD